MRGHKVQFASHGRAKVVEGHMLFSDIARRRFGRPRDYGQSEFVAHALETDVSDHIILPRGDYRSQEAQGVSKFGSDLLVAIIHQGIASCLHLIKDFEISGDVIGPRSEEHTSELQS